jgi:hypothetical protein
LQKHDSELELREATRRKITLDVGITKYIRRSNNSVFKMLKKKKKKEPTTSCPLPSAPF